MGKGMKWSEHRLTGGGVEGRPRCEKHPLTASTRHAAQQLCDQFLSVRRFLPRVCPAFACAGAGCTRAQGHDLPYPTPPPWPTGLLWPLQDCLRALLAVLLNSTQNNQEGCAAVVAAGVLEPAAAVLAQLVRGGPKIKGEWAEGCGRMGQGGWQRRM